MNEYQKKCEDTAVYNDPMYPYYGLVEEVGELFGKLARESRGDGTVQHEDIVSELGDILWMLAMVIREENLSLEEVAKRNLEKLASRQDRGTLKGDGDDR